MSAPSSRGGSGNGIGKVWNRPPWWRGRGRGSSYKGGHAGSDSSSKTSRAESSRSLAMPVMECPYPLWRTYFSDEDYAQDSSKSMMVKAFENFFQPFVVHQSLDEIEMKGSLQVDYTMLTADQGLRIAFPNLAEEIRNHPDTVLSAAALALHSIVVVTNDQYREDLLEDDEAASDAVTQVGYGISKLYIRLFNYNPVVPLKNLKATQYGKAVSIQGTVVRVGNVKPLVTRLAFKCIVCQGIQVLGLQDGKYAIPARCTTPDCKGYNFTPLRGSPLTKTVQWQMIRVQEASGDEQRESGRIPRTIECELTADLVDSCVPGDMVTIVAIVRATGSDEGRGKASKDKCMFLLYLHAISVTNSKLNACDGFSTLQMEFSTKDCYAIQEIQGDQNVFKLIVGSLCPAIYGHEIVKAGLILGLFGGTQRYCNKQGNLFVRGDSHVLLVGDPGLGKSQMLQAAANIAPRGVYVCGNMTTSSGLTVTLTREGGSGDHALEAGALVLADQGCCCIDEFDKMGSQHLALLETMEQQMISIAKAGIVCSLPARTSILAAANPTGGHYNKAKTVSENLKMNSALLSRFDLVFILLDKPDEEKDLLLSEHVMSLHTRNKSSVLKATATRSRIDIPSFLPGEETPLSERLKIGHGEEFDPVPGVLLRKYIGYARKYVHPRLTQAASEVLKTFYLELRKHRHSPNTTPITTRQLESLIRLTEARARLELRENATAQDAKDVVEILKFSMYDTFSDELGLVDFQRSEHGSGMSQRSQGKRLVAELSRVSQQLGTTLFTVQQMKDIAKKIGIQQFNFEDLIFSLNNQNYLLKKGPKTYQLQTV